MSETPAMNESLKTTQFLIAAVVSMALATFATWSTAPSKIGGYEGVGKEFFEDFSDPNAASALRVVTYNESTASARPFTVEKKDGVWSIPSHHNYPADGKDRLAKIASSLIGAKRGAVASLVVADHERFGVVDPLDEKAETLKGRGQRVTLMKEGGAALADLIIGKEVEGQNGTFYCRKADEAQTYKTQLKVEISTKFADWVEADLLKLERDNITRLDSVQTTVSEQGQLAEKTLKLTRDKFSDPWNLDGLDADTEEVNKGDIDAMVTVLDNLKLVGIRERPKMEGKSILGNDLSLRLPKGATRNRQVVTAIVGQLRSSLEEKGFQVFHDEQTDTAQLYSSAGELIAATNDGVRYHLSFGNVFSGSDDEIEKGISTTKKDGEDSKDDKAADEKKDDKKDSGKKSRYLFVRASFLDSLLGAKPTEPMKPTVPEGVEVDENGNVVEPKDAKKDEKKDDAAKTDDKKEEPKKDPAEEYKKALADYKKAVSKYESDLKAFDKKVEDGTKKVKELNDRFGDWYYVISAEDFDKLRLTRDQMVKAKEKKEEKKDDGEAKKDGDTKPDAAKPTDPTTEKPADAKPESKPEAKADEKKAEDKKPEEKPATEKPADDKKADEKKPDEKKPEDKPAEEKKPAADKPAEGDKPKADEAK